MGTNEIMRLLPDNAKSISYDVSTRKWFLNYTDDTKPSVFGRTKLRKGLTKINIFSKLNKKQVEL